jgi:hypothetical protein
MRRRGPNLIGVSDRNETAVEATKGRRAAMQEDMELAKAYRRLPEFCLHCTYRRFVGKVRAIARSQGRSLRDVANQFVDNWAAERARRLQHGRSAEKTIKVRELPDGRKVFYGPSRNAR